MDKEKSPKFNNQDNDTQQFQNNIAENQNEDDQNDVFLSFIYKKQKIINKKLNNIQQLEGRENLKQEQIEKINGKSKLLEEMNLYQQMKNLYNQAYAQAQQQQIKDILKNDKSVLSIQLNKFKQEIINNFGNLCMYGRIMSDDISRSKFVDTNEAEIQQKAFNFYQQNIQIQSQNQQDEEKTIQQLMQDCKENLSQYLVPNNPEFIQMKQVVNQLCEKQDLQNFKFEKQINGDFDSDNIYEEKNENDSDQDQNIVAQKVPEKQINDISQDNTQEVKETKNAIEKVDSNSSSQNIKSQNIQGNISTIVQTKQEYYDGDIEKSPYQSETQNNDSGNKAKSNIQTKKKGSSIYANRRFENNKYVSYDDSSQHEQPRNYRKKPQSNYNKWRQENYYKKDYDTDKERTHQQHQYKYVRKDKDNQNQENSDYSSHK